MITLLFKTHFDAAHFLPGYDGPCGRLHGHRWYVEVEIEGVPDPKTGMIIDFKDVKDALNKILPDHQYLNDFIPEIKIPTAENLAPALFSHLKILLPGLVSLTLWESDNAGCRYVES